ncbi:HvfC family RiPP maturation protein [Acinetobacter sp. ANC 4641]|uniref:HvfC family RiPP maturation protein n=1 Tax=Acinetobacter sp. ANC 4641 TaxID=2529847 RepID=UPI00103D92F4|nr:putative DNA-binding domain-containing protein [Acinetobacter sp. ANC 4641]TCB11972.1 DUF2063 domain-containing protein [Acinetobacter sp. ANC 4641]
MHTETDFQQVQRQFCQALRQDDPAQLPQLQPERLQLYRELLLNNITSFIDNVYPIAKSLLPESLWQQLIHDFFAQEQCQSPFYNEISLQFRDYLTLEQHAVLEQYPWLAELLQYEWLELYLDTIELSESTLENSEQWQLTTQVWVLVYQYPVYQWQLGISIDECQPQPNAIMAWRDVEDQIRVDVLHPVMAILIEQLSQSPQSTEQLTQVLEQYFPQWNVKQYQQQLDELAVYLQQQGLRG